jgi:hypothetical protein
MQVKVTIVVHVMDDSVWWSQVDFDRDHRNMTITAKTLDMKIRHRFTGHYDLGENGLGVETFLNTNFTVSHLSDAQFHLL